MTKTQQEREEKLRNTEMEFIDSQIEKHKQEIENAGEFDDLSDIKGKFNFFKGLKKRKEKLTQRDFLEKMKEANNKIIENNIKGLFDNPKQEIKVDGYII